MVKIIEDEVDFKILIKVDKDKKIFHYECSMLALFGFSKQKIFNKQFVHSNCVMP